MMKSTLLAFMAATVALSATPTAVVSREHPALGRLEGGKSVRYSLPVPPRSFFSLRTDAMQVDLHFRLLAPDGSVVTTLKAPRSLTGAYALVGISDVGGDYQIEISNERPPSERAAYEIRVIELRPQRPEDAGRVSAEQLLNHALDHAGDAEESLSEAARACSDTADAYCRARSSFVFALVYLQKARFKDADREMGRALAFDTNDDYVKGAILNWWLLVKSRLGAYGEAEELAPSAVAAAERAGSPNLRAQAYSRKATVSALIDASNNVEPELAKTVDAAETAGLDAIAAETRIRLAEILSIRGDRRAEDLAKQALDKARQFGLASAEGFALATLCTILRRQGDLQGALDYANEASVVYARRNDPGGQIDSFEKLANLYTALGQLTKAAAFHDKALNLARAAHDKSREAAALLGYGDVKSREGDLAGSLDAFSRSLDLSRTIPSKSAEAAALRAVGMVHAKKGEYDAAEQNYSAAIAISRDMKDSGSEAELLDRLGDLASSRGHNESALDYYRQGLTLRRSIGNKRDIAISELAIARRFRSQGNLEEARALLASALDEVEQQRQRIVAPNLRMTYFGVLQPFYEEYIELLMDLHRSAPTVGYDRTAFQVSEFARARVLLDSLPEIPGAIPPELAERERELRRRIAMIAGTEKPSSSKRLDLLLADYETLYNEIRSRNPRYAAQKSPPILGIDEVSRKLLDYQTVLLEFKVCPDRTYAWVVTKGGVSAAVLPGRNELRALVGRLSEARNAPQTVDADEKYWAAARQLSAAILGPLQQQLHSGRLLLAADDVLQQVSFAGLPWPGSSNKAPAPLIERYTEITVVPSASAFAALRAMARDQQPPKEIAIFADPGLGPSRAQLAGAGAEADAIVKMARKGHATVFKGTQASVKAVEDAHLEDYRYVLFATHATVDTVRPDLSAIILSEMDDAGGPQNGRFGLLDIYGLRLRAELVTLSACDSAAGKAIQGEGLIALSRGFLYAGARAVVAAMWPIDDARSVALVEGLYSRLLGTETVSPAAALRDTQLALWRRGRSPRQWAAFVIIGEPGMSRGKNY